MTNDPGEDPTGSSSDVPLAGRCVGKSYVLVKPIGQGATGTVWRGEDRSTGEPVAIKLLHDSLLRQPRLVTRFVQERTILQMLRHRHVVRVRDLFSVGETLGLVMDLVAGGNLRDHLHRRGTVPPAEAVRLAGQVASALAEAHSLGIIHRDLKPDNILLRDEDDKLETRLTDFGIARILNLPSMTTPNAVVGTPHYMAPEAFHGVTPSPATDVYALGVLLYELVSGHPPYRSDSIPELMRLHAEGQPERRPGIPDPLWRIITMCLAGKPRNRPSAADLVTDLSFLARNLHDAPALSRPGAPPEDDSLEFHPVPVPRRPPFRNNAAPANRWSRHGAFVVAVVVAGTMLASGAATTAWHMSRSGDAPAMVVAPSAQVPVASAAPSRTPVARKITARPSPPVKAARGVAHAEAKPKARVRSSAPSPRPSPPRGGALIPLPEGKAQGRWQCSPRLVFDLRTRTPLGPRPCHQLGSDIQFQAALTAPAGGRGRIEVALRDTRTGRTVAGPRTCDDLSFGRRSTTQECGPLVAEPRRGRRYAVVMTFRYVRGDGRTATSTTTGRPFSW
ncbi:serine/threonine-protein kinase [Actinoplanes sp. NPDC023714]|uniref:serine/threonine-protein kinase n=1 Tax=Actinoplanes sp. NPDC023714 TaxID=3154322 RepID=UPI0033F8A38D